MGYDKKRKKSCFFRKAAALAVFAIIAGGGGQSSYLPAAIMREAKRPALHREVEHPAHRGGSGTPGTAPYVKDGISLFLSSDYLTIQIKIATSDDSDVVVEGCEEPSIPGNDSTAFRTLKAKGTKVILKGKISNFSFDDDQLTSLNVQGCSSLQWFSCCRNKLTSLIVAGCTVLSSFSCQSNQLASLDVSGCSSLKDISCYDNKLASLNVSGCTSLQYLSCYDNKLTSLNVSGCTSLKELSCYNNKLTSLTVAGCDSLNYLACSNNNFPKPAFTKIFDDMPSRNATDNASCILYDESGSDQNYRPSGPELTGIKAKKWKPKCYDTSGTLKDL